MSSQAVAMHAVGQRLSTFVFGPKFHRRDLFVFALATFAVFFLLATLFVIAPFLVACFASYLGCVAPLLENHLCRWQACLVIAAAIIEVGLNAIGRLGKAYHLYKFNLIFKIAYLHLKHVVKFVNLMAHSLKFAH